MVFLWWCGGVFVVVCLVDIIHCYSLHCSNISFIQLFSLLSGYPASSF